MHPEEAWLCPTCIELDANGITNEADYERGLREGIKQGLLRAAAQFKTLSEAGWSDKAILEAIRAEAEKEGK